MLNMFYFSRLWFTKNLSPDPQSLGYKDIMPRQIGLEEIGYPIFEDFKSALRNYNELLAFNPLKGEYISF